jgi:hypothetical protein
MRFAGLTVMVVAVAAFGSGCAADQKVDSVASRSSPSSAGAPSAKTGSGWDSDVSANTRDVSANTKAVCAASKSAVQSAITGMKGPLAEMTQAVTKQDDAAIKTAQGKLKKLFVDAAVELEEQAKVTLDARLKSALVDSAAAYRLAGDSFEQGMGGAMTDPKVDAAGDTITTLCGA